MAYDNQQDYAKFLQKKCLEESCACEGECACSKTEDCGCCPVGLVAVKDADGNIACLTPNDAETYLTNTKEICKPGFAALYKEGTPGVFLGCVSEVNYAELYAIVNPV